MRLLLVFLVMLAVYACANSADHLHERKTYWETLVNSEIPLETNRAAIEQWAQKKAILLSYLPQQNQLDGMLEKIQGNGFACSDWNLILELSLSADGKITREAVKTIGSCL